MRIHRPGLSACLSLLLCFPAAYGQSVASTVEDAATAPTGSVPEGLSTDDWSSIRSGYEAGRHAAVAVDGGHRARNPGQQWTTHFDGRGFTTSPDAGGWTWGLQLAAYGWGAAEPVAAAPDSVTTDGPRVSYAWDAGLTEWYVNDSRGLEHGYTVHKRPETAEGALTLQLAIRGGLLPEVSPHGRDIRFTDAVGGTVLNYSGLIVFDADGRSLAAEWRATGQDLRLRIEDHAARYPLTIDPVAQQTYLKASNTGSGDGFGSAVAASGDTVVIGAGGEDGAATGVDGDQSSNANLEAGAAYVFVRSGTTWIQQAHLKASNPGTADGFGGAVAVSGDTVVVGARLEDSASTGVNGDQGSDDASSSGAAYVFARTGSTWTQQAYFKASNTDADDSFGGAVAISGDTVVAGAFGEAGAATGVDGAQDDNAAPSSGAAYIFVRRGTTWTQQAYLKASNTGQGDAFGRSVTISGHAVVVGAGGEDSAATGVGGDQGSDAAASAGAAYVFVRGGTTWTQQAYLKASNTGIGDRFGRVVAGSGDTVVVLAPSEDSAATGVDGDQGSNDASDAGAAYVFDLDLLPEPWIEVSSGLAGVGGVPLLVGTGTLIGGDWVSLALSNANPSSTAGLVIGLSLLSAPFKGGTLVPMPDILITGLPTDGSGALVINAIWPTGIPSGSMFWVQEWIDDPAGPQGFSASNGLQGTAP